MKKITISLAVICAATPLICLRAATAGSGQTNAAVAKPTISSDSLFTNALIAKGKDVSISRNQLDDEVIRLKAMLAAQGRSPSPEEMSTLEDQVLDSLIGKQLILAKATDADRAKGKEEFTKAIEKIKTNAKITEEQYNQRLSQQLTLLNVTKEEWEKQSAEQATIPVILNRELNVKITDEDVKKFYEENSAKFEQPETVRAAHILLKTTDDATRADLPEDKKAAKKKQIEDLLKRARAGEDFAKLAKEFSEDPGSKENGGEYTFPRGQMVPDFETTAFSQATNHVSEVITTQFGYHIIKTYEKLPARKLVLTDKVPGAEITIGEAVKESLAQQSLQQKAPEYISKLRKDANVEILDPKLKGSSDARSKLENLRDGGMPAAPAAPKTDAPILR